MPQDRAEKLTSPHSNITSTHHRPSFPCAGAHHSYTQKHGYVHENRQYITRMQIMLSVGYELIVIRLDVVLYMNFKVRSDGVAVRTGGETLEWTPEERAG